MASNNRHPFKLEKRDRVLLDSLIKAYQRNTVKSIEQNTKPLVDEFVDHTNYDQLLEIPGFKEAKTLVEGVKTPRVLVPCSEIKQPRVPSKSLADLKGTQDLLRQTGVIP